MKKTIAMQNLDCANCAAKMEQIISKIEGINSCTISFVMQRMLLDIDDNAPEETLQKVKAAVKKIEPDCLLRI